MPSNRFEIANLRPLALVAVAGLSITTIAAAPAQAALGSGAGPVASFTTTSGGLEWVNSGPGNSGSGGSIFTTAVPGSGVQGTASVTFSFLPGSGITGVNNVAALFRIQGTAASGNPASYPSSGTILQKNINNGDYAFIASAPGTSSAGAYGAGTLLLYGKFSGAQIKGPNGGSIMVFYDNSIQGQLSMFSSLWTTLHPGPYWFWISKSGLTTPLSAFPGRALKSFDPDFSGSFGTGAVPEPASWALMIAGFVMTGTALRHRTRRRAIA